MRGWESEICSVGRNGKKLMSHDASVKLPCFCGKVLYIEIQYFKYCCHKLSVFIVGNVGISYPCSFFFFLTANDLSDYGCELILRACTYGRVLKVCRSTSSIAIRQGFKSNLCY
jgi:hypothetical protein